MFPAAVTKTRIAMAVVMATATLAASGLAASLAVARTATAARTTTSQSHRSTVTTQGFAPTTRAGSSSGQAHTSTRGS